MYHKSLYLNKVLNINDNLILPRFNSRAHTSNKLFCIENLVLNVGCNDLFYCFFSSNFGFNQIIIQRFNSFLVVFKLG